MTAACASEEPQLLCLGLGFGVEKATVESEGLPLRADGLTQAVKAAFADCGFGYELVDYRLADLPGEQYYFKEAALALSRTLRVRKERVELWSPADCIGECGAMTGPRCCASPLPPQGMHTARRYSVIRATMLANGPRWCLATSE